MNETEDQLINYILDVFENEGLIAGSEQSKLTKISNIIGNSSTCFRSLYLALSGNSQLSKSVALLHKINKIIAGEDLQEPEKFSYQKINSKWKNENDFLVVLANNREEEPYMKYLQLIAKDKNIKVVKHSDLDSIPRSLIDLVLFTGGEDINPEIYGEELGKYTSINKERDSLEQSIYYNLENSPKLGICRGAQFLTVMSGGKLIQDVAGHNQAHNISFFRSPNSSHLIYTTSSSHHQMMYPFNLDENKYFIHGFSEYFRSNSYLNGNNEQIELPLNFVEPEIIHYKETNSLCIQGHPEWIPQSDKFVLETISLINRTILKNEKI